MTALVAVLAVAVAVLLVVLSTMRRRAAAAEGSKRDVDRLVQDLQARVDRLAAGLSGAGEGLIVLDEGGAVVAANRSAEELASLPAHGCRGRRIREMVPWPRLHEALDACQRDGREVSFELDEVLTSGRVLAVRVRPIAGLCTVVAIDDESRIKRLESLRRDFVANVSHELKTPLAAIQGFVETMLDDHAMPEATRLRFLERIARQTERLTTLVGDLLTLSRLDEAEDATSEAQPCDLLGVLREVLRDLGPLAEKRRLRLVAALPGGQLTVRADREALRQLAGNLVDNAIKYTPEGGSVTVQVSLAQERILLEVIDTGIGLSPEDQARVFERFYRVDRARSRDVGGTGLGLAIVKNTARHLRGEVGVRSQLGRGSTFWVSLPPAAAPAPANQPHDRP